MLDTADFGRNPEGAEFGAYGVCHVRTSRHLTHSFLRRPMQSRHMPTVTIPHRSTPNPAPITQHQRLALLRQFVNRDDIPPQDRVAAVLVLLYAQPLTRITRLCTDDVQHEDGEVLVRLGDPPSPVPAPFDGMLLDYLGQRPNTRTATNPSARWLLPGRRAGQPMTPEAMAPRLRHLGFLTRPGRTAAIRQCLLQAPAGWSPGCSATTTTTPPGWPKRPEELGVTMPPVTSGGDYRPSGAA
ncbi:hypothetical protein [Streptomyces sp. NPDC001811]